MDIIILPFFVFLELFKWILFIDIILSWLPLFGIQIIIPFFHAILAPVYNWIGTNLRARFGMIDFSALVLLLFIQFLELLIIKNFPAVVIHIPYIPIL